MKNTLLTCMHSHSEGLHVEVLLCISSFLVNASRKGAGETKHLNMLNLNLNLLAYVIPFVTIILSWLKYNFLIIVFDFYPNERSRKFPKS